MGIQTLENTCSAVHINGLGGLEDTKALVKEAMRNSAKIAPRSIVALQNALSEIRKNCCAECDARRVVLEKQIKEAEKSGKSKEKPLTEKDVEVWHYRYIIAFTDGNRLYSVTALKEFGFRPLEEYVGYQGKPATIWGLHIPTYLEKNGKLE